MPYLSDIEVPKIDTNNVMLMIGTDCPGAHIPLEVRSGNCDQPYAIRTSLGWAIRGPFGTINAFTNSRKRSISRKRSKSRERSKSIERPKSRERSKSRKRSKYWKKSESSKARRQSRYKRRKSKKRSKLKRSVQRVKSKESEDNVQAALQIDAQSDENMQKTCLENTCQRT